MRVSDIRKSLGKIAYFDEDEDDISVDIDIRKFLVTDVASIKLSSIPKNLELIVKDELGSYHIGHNSIEDDKETDSIGRWLPLTYAGWSHKYSVKTYGNEIMKTLTKLKENNKNVKVRDVQGDGVEDFDIWYEIRFRKNTIVKDALEYFQNFDKELFGHVEIALNQGVIDKKYLKNEEEFTLNVLLPLFRSMGYRSVNYNHGLNEFGKDITFSETDKLGIQRNFGVQVKIGDMAGKVNSILDELIGQIDDAFRLSYIDIYSKERRHISDLVIAISGKFTGNAPQKILEKVHDKNVHFLDIDKIQELLSEYMKKKIE